MTATAAKKEPSKCERYRARVEDHLSKLDDDGCRRAFLRDELAKWTERFENFQREVALGTYQGDATAFDFHITMGDLAVLQSRYIAAAPIVSRLTLQAAE
jgi:hypothetical protein